MRIVFYVSLFLIVYHYLLYPLTLWALARVRANARPMPPPPDRLPSVSILIVVRNGQDLIEEKVANSLSLDYPEDKMEIIVASDGSTDETVARARRLADPRVRVYDYPINEGKIPVINKIFPLCQGEIVVFSDADGLLAKDALLWLVAPFSDPAIGGVCGRKRVRKGGAGFAGPQSRYFSYEDFLRANESRLGAIASNEGKLYAIRRDLFRPLAEAATDDLFNALSIISRGRRFVYEPRAEVYIPPPAGDPAHEVQRRRRIVARSLVGLWTMRRIFNPREYGLYSFVLFSHKVLRRVVPFCFVLLFCASAVLALWSRFFGWLFFLQAVFYVVGVLSHFLLPVIPAKGRLRKILAVPYYFCLGNIGTFLGVWDFLRGKRVTKWEPKKVKS